jgi:hypothetical protein
MENLTLKNKIVEILGLETDPDGEENMLLTRDTSDEILEGVSFKEEVEELVNLFQKEREETLKSVLPEKYKGEDNDCVGRYV